ncbi:MAG TPA: hypothetical protein PL117_16055 [Accumulibacter sp.]|uniref:hypothetical protein n=1 Tax=Accumulibacter sp. TaxID=2053492 RepID=UPI002C9D4AFB|nr:hypothetical protein [Accumulibacter sp.]HRF74279.1 hypothetical protein [Accumulibacter sp.]
MAEVGLDEAEQVVELGRVVDGDVVVDAAIDDDDVGLAWWVAWLPDAAHGVTNQVFDLYGLFSLFHC